MSVEAAFLSTLRSELLIRVFNTYHIAAQTSHYTPRAARVVPLRSDSRPAYLTPGLPPTPIITRALVSAQIVVLIADLKYSSNIEIETDDWLPPQGESFVVPLEVSAPKIEGFVVNAEVLADAVADAIGINADELSVTVTNGDFCPAFITGRNDRSVTKRDCRQKKPRRWLGCRWTNGQCAKKNPDVVQPIPLVCTGDCCELNRRACRGTGTDARKWSRKYKMNPRKSCKYTKDKSMQNKTPDGKCDQELNLMCAHKPNIEQLTAVLYAFRWSSLRAR